MSDKYDSRLQQIIDRYIQSSYGLWNALLTINGIMLAATVFNQNENRSISNIIVLFLALISICLLIYIYIAVKRTYFRVGEVISGNPDELTEEIKEKDINDSLSLNKRIRSIEIICLAILTIQAIIIIISAICKPA